MAEIVGLTSMQRRIVNLLSDGMPHRPCEIPATLGDDLMNRSTVKMAVSRLRKLVEPSGLLIVCEWYNRGYAYRLVRAVRSEDLAHLI